MSKMMSHSAVRLVVLDWDDTCCPSSWIASTPEAEYNEAGNLELLRCVEEGVLTLFQAIEAVGCSVVIITNADEEWVRFSAKRFLPRIVNLLARVRVVSARHYEGLYPGRSVCWKAAAFTHVAKAFFGSSNDAESNHHHHHQQLQQQHSPPSREIISIGDSNDERLAVRAAAAPLHATPKAIKLVDAPTLHTVAAQLHTVTTCLPFLVISDNAIDVDIAAILNYMTLSGNRLRHYHHVAEDKMDDMDESCLPHQQTESNEHLSPEARQYQLWHEAAWGILTAIRFQSVASQKAAANGVEPPPNNNGQQPHGVAQNIPPSQLNPPAAPQQSAAAQPVLVGAA